MKTRLKNSTYLPLRYTPSEEKLLGEMSQMEIIDSHEHLCPERVRVGSPQDVFTLISGYVQCDLLSAGMEALYKSLFDYSLPLEKRWEIFKPYWRAVRYGSYARAALLAAKMVYGVEGINDQTYRVLSEKIAAENTPGIYQRILGDRCRIRAALNQSEETHLDRPLVPVLPGFMLTELCKLDQVERWANYAGWESPKNLDDYLALMKACVEKWVRNGAVGLKYFLKMNLPPDRAKAQEAFKRLRAGQKLKLHPQTRFGDLDNFLLHHLIDLASEHDLVISLHAGVWGDFRHSDSKFLLTLAPAHPQARFDLFHLGAPFIRDTLIIGKNLPNVFLNLCWTHILSPVQTCSAIDELLDQVPVNKILAFGGDYDRPVEKVVGHLHMARENFARVFGSRIDRGLLSREEALEILQRWFWDNPLRIYTRVKL